MRSREYLESMRHRMESYMSAADKIMEELENRKMKEDKLKAARYYFKQAKEAESSELHKLYLELAVLELLEKTNGK